MNGGPRGQGVEPLPEDVKRLLLILEAALCEEGFDFVSVELQAIAESRVGLRKRLTDLQGVVRELRPATPMLANITRLGLDGIEMAIEDALGRTFDS